VLATPDLVGGRLSPFQGEEITCCNKSRELWRVTAFGYAFPPMLIIDNVTVRIAGRMILDGASAAISDGRKVGLIGRNGAGKTTLLKLILGEYESETGRIELSRSWRVGAVAQEAPAGPQSLIDAVLTADKERTELLAALEGEPDPMRLGEIHARLDAILAYAAPARAARILAGLGFPEEDQRRPCAEFSGGWRMRVALAALLFAAPDLLLLDEPTNYLDLEGALWLEDYLKRYRGTMLLVSHDRDLLNRAVDSILHLEHGKLTLYSGGYDSFVEIRDQKRALDAAARAQQEAERKRIQAFIDRFRSKASKASQAQSRIKWLEKMKPVTLVTAERLAAITLPSPKLSRRRWWRSIESQSATRRENRCSRICRCGSIPMTGWRCSARTAMANRHSPNCSPDV